MISLLADFVSAVLLITGAGTMEDLSESEAERFERYASRPLCINLAPRSKLLSSGLMSAYQVASLEDYRSRCGDVLSFAELAAVDGFGREYAQALSQFVSLEASSGGGSFTPVRGSAMVRGSTRSSVNPKGSVKETCSGMKYQIQAGERAEFFLSRRSTYSSPEYGPSTFSAAFYGRRGGKLVAGDFNARFGQGLIMWSGFSQKCHRSISYRLFFAFDEGACRRFAAWRMVAFARLRSAFQPRWSRARRDARLFARPALAQCFARSAGMDASERG